VQNSQKLPVLCIVGPTAIGKSDFGVRVAKTVGGEILSADSMQVYRHMNIGTAKLQKEEMQNVPHHLLDIVNPDEDFSVAQWIRLADNLIADICRRGRLPIVVGGTGLYIRSVVDTLEFGHSSKSEAVRQQWTEFATAHGSEALHRILAERDEQAARRLHPNDVRRVVRALEVLETAGHPLSASYDWRRRSERYHTVQFGLTMDRQQLYKRVEQRVDGMLAAGLVAEVENLLRLGYSSDLISMQAIGYKELAAYFRGLLTLDEAVLLLKRNTRRFVKRQLSWFQRDDRIQWLQVHPDSGVSEEEYHRVCQIGESLQAGIRDLEPE